MMGDGQYLNQSINFAIDEVKVKNLEHCTSDVRGKNQA